MKIRGRDYPEYLPPFEVSSDSSLDDMGVLLAEASMTSREFRDSKENRRLTQSALNNCLTARISHPTSDFIRSRSSVSETEEEAADPSCVSSTTTGKKGGRVSSPTSRLQRDLMRRTALVGGQRENSILDDSMETKCYERCSPERESTFALMSCHLDNHASPTPYRNGMRDESIPRLRRPVHSNVSYRSTSTDEVDDSINVGRPNRVVLHIYDLIAKDTLVQFPSPLNCVCEIGKCFNDVNSALHELGTGAYQ